MNDPALRADLLEARDARQRSLERALGGGGTVLMASANVPGADKQRPGIARLLRAALEALEPGLGLRVLESRSDRLGLFHLAVTGAAPEAAKAAALACEAAAPSGRLLDLDVYRPDGRQLDRAALGLPARACLVCGAPARECILLRRHGAPELLERIDALLKPWLPPTPALRPEALAEHLTRGARRELELTPKPGLVDQRDSGSHPDLSFAAMQASVDLLPQYFDAILACCRERRPLADFIQAGVDAERRMTRAIQSNAHKGYIFLAGLLLMAAERCAGRVEQLPESIAAVARALFASAAEDPHGARIRERHGPGGVRAAALCGLPAVFGCAWPRYREALDAGWEPGRAAQLLMALLMQRVEDTTAVSRCGSAGLARLRADGEALQRMVERDEEAEAWLTGCNEEYRRIGLTMGGVADCMALCFALQEAAVSS